MMEQLKVKRLNDLFEKMMSNKASNGEQKELSQLYQEYIDDGRDLTPRVNRQRNVRKVALN
ncbi:hypothetical protein [Thalassotalea ganghwensis]